MLDIVEDGDVSPLKVHTDEKIADMLTKVFLGGN